MVTHMLAEAGSLPSLPHVAQVQRSNAGKKAVSGSGSQRKHYKTESKDNFVYIQYIAKKLLIRFSGRRFLRRVRDYLVS